MLNYAVNVEQANAELKAQRTFETMKPTATSICMRTEFKIYKSSEILVLANYMVKRNEKCIRLHATVDVERSEAQRMKRMKACVRKRKPPRKPMRSSFIEHTCAFKTQMKQKQYTIGVWLREKRTNIYVCCSDSLRMYWMRLGLTHQHAQHYEQVNKSKMSHYNSNAMKYEFATPSNSWLTYIAMCLVSNCFRVDYRFSYRIFWAQTQAPAKYIHHQFICARLGMRQSTSKKNFSSASRSRQMKINDSQPSISASNIYYLLAFCLQ